MSVRSGHLQVEVVGPRNRSELGNYYNLQQVEKELNSNISVSQNPPSESGSEHIALGSVTR